MGELEQVFADLIAIVGANSCFQVGSQVTCNPPPPQPPSDNDILLLDTSFVLTYSYFDEKKGWKCAAEYIHNKEKPPKHLNQDFISFKRGSINVIVANSEDFFNRFLYATSIAMGLNLLEKADRIELFQSVLYSNGYPEFLQDYLQK